MPLAAAAAPAEIEVRREGGAYVVRAEAELAADLETAWLTVTDYERLPQFVPGVRSARVLARAASGATERLLVEQSGEFRLLLFAQPVHVWLEVMHEPPRSVQARAVRPSGVGAERSTLRDYEGSYRLTAVDARRTRFVYQARIEPSQAMLPWLGTLIVRHTIAEQFGALTAEIERRAAAGLREQAGAARDAVTTGDAGATTGRPLPAPRRVASRCHPAAESCRVKPPAAELTPAGDPRTSQWLRQWPASRGIAQSPSTGTVRQCPRPAVAGRDTEPPLDPDGGARQQRSTAGQA